MKKETKTRERINLTNEELEWFDFTDGGKGTTWELRGETYDYVTKIRTDQYTDGPSWDTVVKRESDDKYFKWNCWDAGDHNGYLMEDGENYMTETFKKVKITEEYI